MNHPAKIKSSVLDRAMVQAIQARAQTGLLAAALDGNAANFAFFQGQISLARSLTLGTGERLAAKDAARAASGDHAQTHLERAWAALPVGAERLTMAQVQQLLAAQGIKVGSDSSVLDQAPEPSTVVGKSRNVLTHSASHERLLDAEGFERRVGLAAGAPQVNTAASIAAPGVRVVLREAPHLILILLRMRLNLLQLRAQIGVLALQRPDALSHKGQMLAQHRRTAALVDQRLHLLQQRLKHFVFLRGVFAGDRTGAVAVGPVNPCATASVLNHVPGQPLQAGAVGLPVRLAGGGDATIAVEVYALGSGVSLAGQGGDLLGRQGAFEIELNGQRFVFDPLGAAHTHRFVSAVEGDVAPIWQMVQAVNQKDHAELGNGVPAGVVGHVSTPLKTAILSLPQGMGKTTMAHQVARWLGCTAIVDEWTPSCAVLPGALHLTSCEVPA